MRGVHGAVLGKIRDTMTLVVVTAGQVKTIIGDFVKTFA
jgi:hypothetical protein